MSAFASFENTSLTRSTDTKPHLLLAATGSVAAIKIPQILRALSTHPELSVRLVLTKKAERFLCGQSAEQPSLEDLLNIPNVDGIYRDEDEWAPSWRRGARVLHVELRRWADVMVVAPLSANSMAKVVGGVCDNLFLSVMRAWDTTGTIDPVRYGRRKLVIVAPAMNTAMWKHPVTAQQIGLLEGDWGYGNGGWVEVLKPVEKELACGDTGIGAMRAWEEITKVAEHRLGLR